MHFLWNSDLLPRIVVFYTPVGFTFLANMAAFPMGGGEAPTPQRKSPVVSGKASSFKGPSTSPHRQHSKSPISGQAANVSVIKVVGFSFCHLPASI